MFPEKSWGEACHSSLPVIWQLVVWKGGDDRIRNLQASLLEDSVASYMIKGERSGCVAFGGIWGLTCLCLWK